MPDTVAHFPGDFGALILDSLPEGIFISDSSGKSIYINKMYQELTGLKQEDIEGKNVRSLREAGIFDHILNPEVVRTRKSTTHVQRLKDGTQLVLTGQPVFSESGDVKYVVTFVRDITLLTNLQNEVEEQRALIDRINGQLAHMVHENIQAMPIYASQAMKEMIRLLKSYAATDATVLLLGETGVGKEIVGKYLHSLSSRKNKVLIKVDCGGIAENLTESELFGYMPGAFTGASPKGKTGYFEIADGSNIFLDEIGELPVAMQSRLLRVLQDGEIVRVGGTRPRKVDVRIIAATNRDLSQCVEEGSFRRDLFYRLNVATLYIPPLRERPEDIRPLSEHFLKIYMAKYHKTLSFKNSTIEKLMEYSWPGNVRELQNTIHSLVITNKGATVEPDALPPLIFGQTIPQPNAARLQAGRPLKDIMADIEADFLRKALDEYGSVRRVSELFHIDRSTIFRKLKNSRFAG